MLCKRRPAEGHSCFKQLQLQITYTGAPKYHLSKNIIRLHSIQQGYKIFGIKGEVIPQKVYRPEEIICCCLRQVLGADDRTAAAL